MSTSNQSYFDRVQHLRTGRGGDHEKPHKPAMLLAIADLIATGRAGENQIRYSPELLEVFRRYFDIVRSGDDRPNAHLPFWHLRGDKFFHHEPLGGQKRVYDAASSVKGAGELNRLIDYAYLDDELFAMLSDEATRCEFRNAIIDRYFANHRIELLAISEEEREIGIYEKAMEERIDDGSQKLPQVREGARDAAFGRTVRKAYDYRCAACGIRVVLDDIFIVDAAHLIPFLESHDDDPRNGIALCKNHHWSMDRSLIAPGADLQWHVSRMLDDRIEGQRDLIGLRSRSVILPAGQRYHPRQDALQWRQERLLK